MFRMGKFSDTALPANQDCLLQQRANYQAAVWKRVTTRSHDNDMGSDIEDTDC